MGARVFRLLRTSASTEEALSGFLDEFLAAYLRGTEEACGAPVPRLHLLIRDGTGCRAGTLRSGFGRISSPYPAKGVEKSENRIGNENRRTIYRNAMTIPTFTTTCRVPVMAILFAALGPPLALPQAQEPTAAETVEYINEKLARCGDAANPREISLLSSGKLRISGHTGLWFRLSKDGPEHFIPVRYIETVDPKGLSTNVTIVTYDQFPDNITMTRHARLGFVGHVYVKCRSANCLPIPRVVRPPVVREHGEGVDAWWSLGTDVLLLSLCDVDDLGRVQRAFQHLLRVSGAKEELF